MTSTAASGSRVRLTEGVAPGPPLGRWGTTASPAERELDDPLLAAVRGDRPTRLRPEPPGTASGSLLVRVEVRP